MPHSFHEDGYRSWFFYINGSFYITGLCFKPEAIEANAGVHFVAACAADHETDSQLVSFEYQSVFSISFLHTDTSLLV